MLETKQNDRKWLAAILLAGILVRLGLAAVAEGYSYDVGCFFAWAFRMAEIGPRAFYADGYFCDYPPAYLYVLWAVGKVLKAAELSYTAAAARVVLAAVPALADGLSALVMYRIAARRGGSRLALRFAAFAAACPLFLYDTGVWKQIDGVFGLAMLVCFALLEEKKPLRGAVCYGLALAIKPQALLAGPVLAVCFAWPLLFGENGAAPTAKARLNALKTAVLGVVCALAPVALSGLPFWGAAGLWDGLGAKYFATATSYPYATINAFNLMAFLGGEWTPQNSAIVLELFGNSVSLFTWQQLGVALLCVLTAALLYLAFRAQRAGRFSPLLLAAFYTVGVFTLGHRMHERYLLLGVVLLAAAAARFADRGLLALAGGFSVTGLLNLAVVYGTVGSDDEFLTSAISVLMARGIGFAETVLFCVLAGAVWKNCTAGVTKPFAPQKAAVPAAPKPQPVWTRRERLCLLGLTAAVAAVSFFYLGDTKAPQTALDANGGYYSETVEVNGDAVSLWVYPGIATSNHGRLLITDAAGNTVLERSLDYGAPFRWTKNEIPVSATYTISVSDGMICELAFRDANGQLLAVREIQASGSESVTGAAQSGAVSAMLDEPGLVPDTISQLNGFYFDEIYHARTGYESLHKMTIYETTHPPLGKDFMALGIALFGMTAFGWRFFGTLLGVLMVPVLYLLARRLTRKPGIAAFAALLLSFDFMRFTQSRMATIDSYSGFFILLSAYFMVWYCQSVLEKGVLHSILPMALCGTAFGLGCASKWTGIYAGIGLAVLYFGVLARRCCQLTAARSAVEATDGTAMECTTTERTALNGKRPEPHGEPAASARLKQEVLAAFVGGVVFFVTAPVLIYLVSYLPYWMKDPSFGLSDWWNCQLYMYRYHSGLEATHPFASGWYSWPFDLRPVWYYMGGGLTAGKYASIAGFFSPIVVWGGLAAWLRLCARGVQGRGSAAGGAVIVFLLSQLAPWMLVTRCTFLYHYFPCLVFLILAMALWLAELSERHPQLAKKCGIGLTAAAAGVFVWFYPVLSGLPVGHAWAASLQWLSSWGFYIL